jgi:hypothetical protein
MELLVEHDSTPGTIYEDRLILGGAIGAVLNEMTLNESTDSSGSLKFRGKFQEAEAVNKNKRMYPYTVLNQNVLKLDEVIKNGGLVASGFYYSLRKGLPQDHKTVVGRQDSHG